MGKKFIMLRILQHIYPRDWYYLRISWSLYRGWSWYGNSYKNSNQDKKVYVVISEGELDEGSTWEALLFAKHREFDNLTVIIDINFNSSKHHCLNLDPIKKKNIWFRSWDLWSRWSWYKSTNQYASNHRWF